jgi:hypothetical protein
MQQVVERLEDRQVSLGACQAFRTPAARDYRAFGPRRQLDEEVVYQARLADARLAGHSKDDALAIPNLRVGAAEVGTLDLAADGLSWRNSRSPRWFGQRLAGIEGREAPRPLRALTAGARAPWPASGARARQTTLESPD